MYTLCVLLFRALRFVSSYSLNNMFSPVQNTQSFPARSSTRLPTLKLYHLSVSFLSEKHKLIKFYCLFQGHQSNMFMYRHTSCTYLRTWHSFGWHWFSLQYFAITSWTSVIQNKYPFNTGVLIRPLPNQVGNKLQRQKILIFIYPIYNLNWRDISTIYTHNKTSIKRNILTIKQNTPGSRSG